MRASRLTLRRSVIAFLVVAAPSVAAFVGCGSSDGSGTATSSSGSHATSVSSTTGTSSSGGGSVASGSSSSGAPDLDGSTNDAASDASDAGEDGSLGDAGVFADGGEFSGNCGAGHMGEPTSVRCIGLYSDFASKTVASNVHAYDPGLHLWSDNADKSRWIYLPENQTIDTSDMDEWTFPVGTKIFKEFRLAVADAGTPIRIETRMMWKQAAGEWYFTTYRWTPDGETDATELTGGEFNVAGTTYEIPSQAECGDCHNGRIDTVMGFEAVALSTAASSGLNMQALVAQHLLTAPPAAPIVNPGDANTAAALGWIHMNCGVSCHNSGNGPGATTSFFTRLDVATLATVESTKTYSTGWNVPTSNFSDPGVTTTYRFHACDLAGSSSYYRADVRDGVDGVGFGTQMPQTITHEVDTADMAAVAAWINAGCDGGM